MRWRSFSMIAVLWVSGCAATLSNDRTVCPESRDLRCVANPVCSYDDARQCRVCRCGAPLHLEPEDPEAVPGQDPVGP